MPKPTLRDEWEVDTEQHETESLLAYGVQDVDRHLTPLAYSVDILPGVPHRISSGFAAAAEFREYSEATPLSAAGH